MLAIQLLGSNMKDLCGNHRPIVPIFTEFSGLCSWSHVTRYGSAMYYIRYYHPKAT